MYPASLATPLQAYQKWLRAELDRSSLAQRFATGLAWLPDFVRELPSPLGYLFSFTRPRTLPQMVPHLIIFLEWYMQPQRAAPLARKALVLAIHIAALLLAFLVMLIYTRIFNWGTIAWFLSIFTTSSGTLVTLLTYGVSSAAKRSINATELYWYLRREFSETAAACVP